MQPTLDAHAADHHNTTPVWLCLHTSIFPVQPTCWNKRNYPYQRASSSMIHSAIVDVRRGLRERGHLLGLGCVAGSGWAGVWPFEEIPVEFVQDLIDVMSIFDEEPMSRWGWRGGSGNDGGRGGGVVDGARAPWLLPGIRGLTGNAMLLIL